MKNQGPQLLIPTVVWLWLFAVNLLAHALTHAPAWPMYMTGIFFFLLSDNGTRKLTKIFFGGIAGIVASYAFVELSALLQAPLGSFWALALPLFVMLGLLIVVGHIYPLFLNGVALCYFTICLIDATQVPVLWLDWLLMLLVGGGILLGGVILLLHLLKRAGARKALFDGPGRVMAKGEKEREVF